MSRQTYFSFYIPSPLSPPFTFASLGFCCGASASRKRVRSVGDAVDKGWGFVCSTFSFLYFFCRRRFSAAEPDFEKAAVPLYSDR